MTGCGYRHRKTWPVAVLVSWLVLAATSTFPANVSAQPTADLGLLQEQPDALARFRAMTAVDDCNHGDDAADEILVCGTRANSAERYRLPITDDKADTSDRVHAGEAPHPSLDIVQSNACGIFEGQRHCAKAESRKYGMGGGNDPLTVLVKLGTALVDPDADLSPPPPLPAGARPRPH